MFKENPDTKCNEDSDYLRAKLYPVKLLTFEKKLKENLSNEGNHEQKKADINVLERGYSIPTK